ncbi:MAG: DUF1549 domain-containing protein, partial [Planctomycetota bacterium]|nr:DUF1549 domain-containing protein [Planctomycetota bacterium]
MRGCRLPSMLVALTTIALGFAAPLRAGESEVYLHDIKPLLEERCFACHGALRQEGDLRLDTVQFMKEGGATGPAVVAGKGAKSLLVLAVLGKNDVQKMPMEGRALEPDQVAKIERWIDQGASAPENEEPQTPPEKHWAFQIPQRPALPAVSNPDWQGNPIDHFVAAQHQAQGVTPLAEAPKHVLLRRVYLDLIGLPPTRAQLAEFLADESPDAYEKVVDQLLASPQYAERWARHWMDIWRYSDWDGFKAEVRESRPNLWKWRDWIIRAVQDDKPYDEMVVKMLAADEIDPLDKENLPATGYLARNWFKFNRDTWLDNVVEHTGKAFMGMTFNCGRCHSHKYDPWSHKQYYSLRAFFEPYDVREEPLRGPAPDGTHGDFHVFDQHVNTPTYLFERGVSSAAVKDEVIEPLWPELLGEMPKIKQVELPVQAYAEAFDRFFLEKRRKDKENAITETAKDVKKHEREMLSICSKDDPYDQKREVRAALVHARQAVAVKRAELAALEASYEADYAKLLLPNDRGNRALASQAGYSAADLEYQKALLTLRENEKVQAHEYFIIDRFKKTLEQKVTITGDPLPTEAELLKAGKLKPEETQAEIAKRKAMDKKAGKPAAKDDPNKPVIWSVELVQARIEMAQKYIEDLQKKAAVAQKDVDKSETAMLNPTEKYTLYAEVYPSVSTGRRTAYAQAIASRKNPLTARVAINHIWARHFGRPLVTTVFDFGMNGNPPSHPELLDWLAVEFMDGGWKMKPIHRLIVTSRAYRMLSTPSGVQMEQLARENLAKDMDNVWIWKANARRVEAEVVRDTTLFVAGSLSTEMFGPDLDPEQSTQTPRRSIYFRSSKEKKVDFLDVFDRAGVVECYRRNETVAPQQALALANSQLSRDQSRKLAASLTAEVDQLVTGSTVPLSPDQEFVSRAFLQ